MFLPKNNSQNTFKNTDFFFHQSWRILSSENEERKQRLHPPKKITDAEQTYHNFMISSKNYQYYKTKRNRFFKEICDFNESYIRKFETDQKNDPSPASSFVFKPEASLFESKKDRKVNENNKVLRQANSTAKAKTLLKFLKRKNEESMKSSITNDLQSILNNETISISEELQKTYHSFTEITQKIPNEKPQTAPSFVSKYRSFHDRKRGDTTPLEGENKMARIMSCKPKPLEGMRKTFHLEEDPLKKNGKTFYFPTQPRSSQSRVRTKIGGVNQKPSKKASPMEKKNPVRSFIVEEFLKNFELLKKNIQNEVLTRFILKKIKKYRIAKTVFLENKKVKYEAFNRDFLYEILKSNAFFRIETPEGEIEERGREKFLVELTHFKTDLENFIVEKNNEELRFLENSLVNSYEEYKIKEISVELNKEKGVNFYKNRTFDQDVEEIRKNFDDNNITFAKDLETFERNFGECYQINNREKKIMRNTDFFYRNLQRKFQNIKEKYKGDNPYFAI